MLSVCLLTLAGLPAAVVAGRDLALNFRTPANADFTKATAHAKARTAAIAFAVTAPLLSLVSLPLAIVFWVASMLFVFALVPNRVLTDPNRKRKERRRER